MIDEVVAENFRCGLEFAVDTAIPLFQAAGVPRNVEMEEVAAVGLKVEAFAGSIGGD